MKTLPKIVIVGRPNVGKSSLFNRIIKKQIAITSDQPQTTRDRIYGESEWLTKKFILVDTGGISSENNNFQTEINSQVNIAIQEANLVIFVCSYQEGLTIQDQEITKLLRKVKVPVILIANKYDNIDNQDLVYDFFALGYGTPILVSTSHGIGIGELLDKIISFFNKMPERKIENIVNMAVIGRPNVGKSSLVNTILKENRVIVSPISGTTTDAIDSYFVRNNQKYCLIDTAGIRRKGRITENLEKYSVMRTQSAIERSDIILFLIDGNEGIIEQDLTIAGVAKNLNKPVIIVINKWDLVEKDEYTIKEYNKNIKSRFKYLDYALIVYLSALEQTRIFALFQAVQKISNNMKIRIKTSVVNEIIKKAQLINQAPNFNGGRLKIYYATQTETEPPTFILMVNNKNYCHFSYKRFLINQFRDNFGFEGLPIKINLRNRKSLYDK